MIVIIVLALMGVSFYGGIKYGNIWTINKFSEKAEKLSNGAQEYYEKIKTDLKL